MGNKSKRYFFVDLENVHRDGLKGVDKLTENDYVRIYYSNPLETLPMFLHRQIVESDARFDYVTVEMPIKNAADCMILLDINTMAKSKKKKDAIFTIVSKDSDFDRPIAEMKAQGLNIRKISVLCDDTQRPKTSSGTNKPLKITSDSKSTETKVSEKEATRSSGKKAEAKAKKKDIVSVNPAEDKTDGAPVKNAVQSEAVQNILNESNVRSFLIEHLDDFDITGDRNGIIEQTVQAVITAKTKVQVNTNLLKIFDCASVKIIYNELKPLIQDLPGQ